MRNWQKRIERHRNANVSAATTERLCDDACDFTRCAMAERLGYLAASLRYPKDLTSLGLELSWAFAGAIEDERWDDALEIIDKMQNSTINELFVENQ